MYKTLMENSTVRSSYAVPYHQCVMFRAFQELFCHDVWSFIFLVYPLRPQYLPRLFLLQLWISYLSQKRPRAVCIQLGFTIYNVSNGEKVRISKKKEWCPSLCCGLWRLLLADIEISLPLLLRMTPIWLLNVLKNDESRKKSFLIYLHIWLPSEIGKLQNWEGKVHPWTLWAEYTPHDTSKAQAVLFIQ